MRCGNCGAELGGDGRFCGSCGAPAPAVPSPAVPPPAPNPQPVRTPAAASVAAAPSPARHPAPATTGALVWAIVATSCCCLPLGVVGIVFAVQASSAVSSGDYAAADDLIAKSKKWSMIGVVLGLIGYGLYAAIVIAASLAQ